jgi:Phage major capsid protein E
MLTDFKKAYNVPGRGDVHIDGPLTNISVAFLQAQESFIADRVFPVIPVAKQSDKFFTLPRGAFFRDEMQQRGPGDYAPLVNYDVSNDSYDAEVWSAGVLLADQIRANYDSPLDADREMTELLTQKGLLKKEVLWAADHFAASKWTGDQTGVDNAAPGANEFGRWDRADSQPIEVIRKGRRTVHQRTGFMPNKLVLGREVYDALLDHPDIVGRIDRGQTSGPAIVMRQNLAALFELDEILVMDAIQNSAAEGASDSLAYIGGKSALLLYVPKAPGLMTPSAGYTFAWTGLQGGGLGLQMRRFREERAAADLLELNMSFQQKRVAADLAQFFITAVN